VESSGIYSLFRDRSYINKSIYIFIYNKFNTFFTIVELTGYDWYTIKLMFVVILCESDVALIIIHNFRYCEKSCVPYGFMTSLKFEDEEENS